MVPQGEERARTIAELQETDALGHTSSPNTPRSLIGASQQASKIDAKQDLIAAQLLIEVGANLAEVERWIPKA